MIEVSVVLFPQLLGEYDSLLKEHEGLKVMDLMYYVLFDYLIIIETCQTVSAVTNRISFLLDMPSSLCVSTEQRGVNREQACRCK